MDIISEIQSNAHETPVVREMLKTFFIANPHLIEFMPCKDQTINQRYHLWSSMPSELLVLSIRSALTRYQRRTSANENIQYVPHYEITLTVPDSLQNAGAFLQLSIGKIINSKMFMIEKAYYVFEKTESGTPHVHMLVKPMTGYNIIASKIKKIYPHRFSFAKVRDLHAYCEYLIKDLDNMNHIEFKDIQNPPPPDYANQNRC